MARLDCCKPTAADGQSQTSVHGPLCDRSGHPLSTAEYLTYKARLKDEATSIAESSKGTMRYVPPPPSRTRKVRRREHWNVGFREPTMEELT